MSRTGKMHQNVPQNCEILPKARAPLLPVPHDGRSVSPDIPSISPPMTSNGNVLVIDDDPARAARLAALVSSAGFHTEVITDINNTDFALGAGSDLDVILCELDLKGVSWGEARRTLREMDVQVPAIMFSDVAEADRMMTALRLGADQDIVQGDWPVARIGICNRLGDDRGGMWIGLDGMHLALGETGRREDREIAE